MVEKFGLPVSASIKETGASKKEKELTPDELLEKEAEKISMDMNREGMKGEIERLKKKIAEINEAEKKNSGVKIADKRGGAEVVNNGKNEEVAHIEKDIRVLENDLKNIENKKRIKDIREEIKRLEVEAGKKYAGGGYIDKTEASFDQQIAEKEAELKKIENIISGNKELPKEKTEEIEIKNEEPIKAEETGKRTMEEVEKERAEKAQKEMDERFPKKESTVETVYPTTEARQAKIDSEKSDYEKAVEEIDADKDGKFARAERERNLLRLEKELENSRMDLAKMDLKKGKLWQRVTGFFKKDTGKLGEDKDVAFMRERYEESLRAYKASFLEEAKRGNITEDEIGYIFEYFDKDEKAKLYDSRTEARLENVKGTKFEFIREHCANAINWYINLKPPYLKTAAAIGLGGGAAAATIAATTFGVAGAGTAAAFLGAANIFRRYFTGTVTGVMADKYLDKKGEERRNFESDLKVRSLKGMLNKNEFTEGVEGVPLSAEEKVKILEDWLDGNEKKVSADLQKRKLGSLFKKSSAALAGYLIGSGELFRGIKRVGGLAADFISDNTQVDEYIGEKFDALKETDLGKWMMEKLGLGGPGVIEKSETGGAGVKPDASDVVPTPETAPETPEAPEHVEAPAKAPIETPEAPIEKPAPAPWSQEVIEQQGESFPVHEFSREEITKALHERFNMFSGTYDNLSSSKMGEFLNMRPGMMYTTGTPWEGYDYNEFSGFQKSLHEFYDGLSPEQQAEASKLSVDEFVKKHGVDYLGSGDVDVAQAPVENIKESIAGAGAEIGAGEQVIPSDTRIANIIGFTENEYNQIKTVKVRDLLKTMPIGDNPRGLAGLNVRGTAFDLPQDGFPGPLEMARQLDLANYINEFHPSGTMNDMTVEEFLQKNPPGKNIFKILMLDPGDYQEIQGKSVDELLKEVPTSKDASFFQSQAMAEKIQVADYIRGHKLTPEMRSMSIKEFLEGNGSASGGGGQVDTEELPKGWQSKSIEGNPVETKPGAEFPERKEPISGPRVEENFNPDTEKEMHGGRPYNADELIKETDKMEHVPNVSVRAQNIGSQMSLGGVSRDSLEKIISAKDGQNIEGFTDKGGKIHVTKIDQEIRDGARWALGIRNQLDHESADIWIKNGVTKESLRDLISHPPKEGEIFELELKNGEKMEVRGGKVSNRLATLAMEKMENHPKQPGMEPSAGKTPAQMYEEATKNREGAAGNAEAGETPQDQPMSNAEERFPYPKETIAQGNEYLHRGYTEESLRRIANAGPLDGKPVVGGRILDVVSRDGKHYPVLINHDSQMAAKYSLNAMENFTKMKQEVSGGDINKWNAIKDQPVERVVQSNELTLEQKRALLKRQKLSGALAKTVGGVIKRALKQGLGGGYY